MGMAGAPHHGGRPMAENHDQERTLPATPRRLEQARAEGQVARSRELSTALLLLAAAGAALAAGPVFAGWLGGMLRRGLTLERAAALDSAAALEQAGGLALDAFTALLPVLALLAALALAAPLALGGWLFTTKPLEPDFSRLSPARWARQAWSLQGLAELGKALAKAALIAVAALALAWALRERLALLLAMAPAAAIAEAARLAGFGLLAAGLAMLAIAGFDVPVQLWRHHQSLRMSVEEMRREMKEAEGDPIMRQRIRSQQREAARRRMMAEVPRADVVVTNPQHYAVALAWNENAMRAPRVVAKGADLVAARIRELAAAHGVPLIEAPPLARALHRHAEIGDEIPAALYAAVAQLLAWAYALKSGRAAAGGPGDIEVPAGLDPAAGGEGAA
jgi:flagellar biosynthetic protein FlhB